MPATPSHDLLQRVDYLRSMVMYGTMNDIMEALCDVNITFTDMQEGPGL